MTVHAILTRKGSTVCTIQPAASIADATKSLARHGIGALVVVKNHSFRVKVELGHTSNGEEV